MSYKKKVLFLILLSIAVNTLFLFISGHYCHPQPFEYEEIALNLLHGNGYSCAHFNTTYYAYLPPGFPVLCYLIYVLFGHHTLLVIGAQIIANSLLVAVISSVGRRVFDETTAVVAGLLVALYPPLIIYATTKLHTLPFDSLLFALCLFSFLLLQESTNGWRIFLTGLCCAIALLFRTTVIVFIFFALIWFYFASPETVWKKLRAAIAILALCGVFLAPWCIRSYAIFKDPFIFSTNKFECFWFGNMPNSTGSLFSEKGITLQEKAAPELPAGFFDMGELQQGKALSKLTKGYFKADPRAFFERIVKKVYYFWYFSPAQGSFYPEVWMKAYKLYYLCILLPAILSFAFSILIFKKEARAKVILVGILFASFTISHALYYVEGRHRWSIEPFLLLFTAYALVEACRFSKICIKKAGGD